MGILANLGVSANTVKLNCHLVKGFTPKVFQADLVTYVRVFVSLGPHAQSLLLMYS